MSENLIASTGSLSVVYGRGDSSVQALDNVTLAVSRGSSLGIVGESGSGKSTVGKALGMLLPRTAQISGGITIDGHDLQRASEDQRRDIRTQTVSFVLQDPMGSLDPTARIGRQLRWALGADKDADELGATLERVGLRDPKRVMRSYPFQLSGGMAQRVTIAMALGRRAQLIVADEPTAALDPSVRQGILSLLTSVKDELGCAIVMLTHDITSVGRLCDEAAVMYAGRVVESGAAREVVSAPQHPYTAALLASRPGKEAPGTRLKAIPGATPVMKSAAADCSFRPRCTFARDICSEERPPLEPIVGGHDVACLRAAEFQLSGGERS